MKRFSTLLLAAIFCSMLGAQAQKAGAKQAAHKAMTSPYKIENTNLRFGNSMFAMKVMEAWKAYDDNMLDKVEPMLADDMWATMADGAVVKGKDAFMTALKEYRNGFSGVVSEVSACTTLKSAEYPDRDVVVVWGRETDIKTDGTTQKVSLHEIWMFNKAGKITEFHQYAKPLKEDMK